MRYIRFLSLILLISLSSCMQDATSEPPFLARTSQAWYDQMEAQGTEVIRLTSAYEGPLNIVDGCVAIGENKPVLLIVEPDVELVRDGGSWALRNASGVLIPIGATIAMGGGGGTSLPNNLEGEVPLKCHFYQNFTGWGLRLADGH